MFDRVRAWMHVRGSAKMVRRRIGEQLQDYLERFYLLAVGPYRLFMHIFHMDDPDPLHDHPWGFGRLILWGSYREHYIDGTHRVFRAGHILWHRDSRVFHRLELLTPTVGTLFWHGAHNRGKDWGMIFPLGAIGANSNGWKAASSMAIDDKRVLKGWLLPRKVGVKPAMALPPIPQTAAELHKQGFCYIDAQGKCVTAGHPRVR